MDNSVKKTENLDWVDALKGIAIVGVVAIHAGGSHLPGAAGKRHYSSLVKNRADQGKDPVPKPVQNSLSCGSIQLFCFAS